MQEQGKLPAEDSDDGSSERTRHVLRGVLVVDTAFVVGEDDLLLLGRLDLVLVLLTGDVSVVGVSVHVEAELGEVGASESVGEELSDEGKEERAL